MESEFLIFHRYYVKCMLKLTTHLSDCHRCKVYFLEKFVTNNYVSHPEVPCSVWFEDAIATFESSIVMIRYCTNTPTGNTLR